MTTFIIWIKNFNWMDCLWVCVSDGRQWIYWLWLCVDFVYRDWLLLQIWIIYVFMLEILAIMGITINLYKCSISSKICVYMCVLYYKTITFNFYSVDKFYTISDNYLKYMYVFSLFSKKKISKCHHVSLLSAQHSNYLCGRLAKARSCRNLKKMSFQW